MQHVGVDLLYLSRLAPLEGQWDDPFFIKTFTEDERVLYLAAASPILAFSGGFAAKEAVFKSLGIPSDMLRLNQIEVLRNAIGQPAVTLHDPLKAMVPSISHIHLSISYESDAVIAFAVSE